MTKKT